MAVCMMLGLELGTPTLLEDQKFIWSVAGGFLISTILSFFICIFIAKWVVKILEIPNWIYAFLIGSIVLWSSMQYTGTINDFYILILCSIVGIFSKKIGLSRPAILLAYVVAEKFENYTQQSFTLYTWSEILSRPLTVVLLIISIFLIINSIRKFRGINYN
jgi:putative tricarboxylic transport membrane protein